MRLCSRLQQQKLSAEELRAAASSVLRLQSAQSPVVSFSLKEIEAERTFLREVGQCLGFLADLRFQSHDFWSRAGRLLASRLDAYVKTRDTSSSTSLPSPPPVSFQIPSRTLASILNAFARVGIANRRLLSSAARTALLLPPRDLHPVDCAQMCNAFAKLKFFDAHLFRWLSDRAVALAPDMDVQGLTSVCNAFSKLPSPSAGASWNVKSLFEELLPEVERRVDKLRPGEVAQIANAYARVFGETDPGPHTVCRVIERGLESDVFDRFSVNELVMCLNAAVKAAAWDSDPCSTFFQRAELKVVEAFDHLDGPHMAVAVNAFARAGGPSLSSFLPVFERLKECLPSQMERRPPLSSTNLFQIANALSRRNIRDTHTLELVAIRSHFLGFSAFEPVNLALLVGAFARSDLVLSEDIRRELLEAASDHVSQGNLNPIAMAALAYALSASPFLAEPRVITDVLLDLSGKQLRSKSVIYQSFLALHALRWLCALPCGDSYVAVGSAESPEPTRELDSAALGQSVPNGPGVTSEHQTDNVLCERDRGGGKWEKESPFPYLLRDEGRQRGCLKEVLPFLSCVSFREIQTLSDFFCRLSEALEERGYFASRTPSSQFNTQPSDTQAEVLLAVSSVLSPCSLDAETAREETERTDPIETPLSGIETEPPSCPVSPFPMREEAVIGPFSVDLLLLSLPDSSCLHVSSPRPHKETESLRMTCSRAQGPPPTEQWDNALSQEEVRGTSATRLTPRETLLHDPVNTRMQKAAPTSGLGFVSAEQTVAPPPSLARLRADLQRRQGEETDKTPSVDEESKLQEPTEVGEIERSSAFSGQSGLCVKVDGRERDRFRIEEPAGPRGPEYLNPKQGGTSHSRQYPDEMIVRPVVVPDPPFVSRLQPKVF
uniref:RAP domain-containing protein n=1 Tax=Chromera velia CCMP2878 TaxID=1169474 RepID=A0A0G4I7W1_9ALVE|eukprot:Cvel_11694.t1-p1 / transcript=Cvel_11694.t1 / gene=Cvel_11694 / organism=Chromera_velia_CCMP2878 / gene_product=hypothetical protein / transcript_product=hypothetical protein / location=Cvel_scaffold741:49628-52909(+) / protein_length=890 / sequence_SO=supercontig / SO=protein_coding / is_pseudo=false